MTLSRFNGISISGIVNVLPHQRVYNDTSELIESQQRTQLIEVTGINERRRAKLTCIEHYFSYGMDKLLTHLQWDTKSIDILLCVTQTAFPSMPAVSCVLQAKHNLSSDTQCFDINLGCSGYVYGLQTAMALLQSVAGSNARAILCCGDLSSLLLDPNDKSTQPVFSDGVSVTALSLSGQNTPAFFNTSTYGDGKNAIYTELNGNKEVMRLNGIDVFNYSVRYVPAHVKALLQFAHTDTQNTDAFIFHQANKLINGAICNQLHISPDKAPETLSLYGNTASASIPITLGKYLCTSYHKPVKVLLCGFGVGFSIASCLLTVDSDLFVSTEEWE